MLNIKTERGSIVKKVTSAKTISTKCIKMVDHSLSL